MGRFLVKNLVRLFAGAKYQSRVGVVQAINRRAAGKEGDAEPQQAGDDEGISNLYLYGSVEQNSSSSRESKSGNSAQKYRPMQALGQARL
jgi:hypothetical protein